MDSTLMAILPFCLPPRGPCDCAAARKRAKTARFPSRFEAERFCCMRLKSNSIISSDVCRPKSINILHTNRHTNASAFDAKQQQQPTHEIVRLIECIVNMLCVRTLDVGGAFFCARCLWWVVCVAYVIRIYAMIANNWVASLSRSFAHSSPRSVSCAAAYVCICVVSFVAVVAVFLHLLIQAVLCVALRH